MAKAKAIFRIAVLLRQCALEINRLSRGVPACTRGQETPSDNPLYRQLAITSHRPFCFATKFLRRLRSLGRTIMKKYAIAAALIGLFVTPALALTAGTYYVGLDTA